MSFGITNDIAEVRIGIKNRSARAFFALIIDFIEVSFFINWTKVLIYFETRVNIFVFFEGIV